MNDEVMSEERRKCEYCGVTDVPAIHACDPYFVEYQKVRKFIESEGFGRMNVYFDVDSVVHLMIKYKQETKQHG
jgi:hypothetical protein